MSSQQFCLRWNNHQPNLVSVLKSLLNSESLVDVTLAAEGRHLQAHKVVLSACSSYFQTLFTINPCQHPIVILKDVKYNDLKTMVDFMYFGEVNVSQEQLPAVLKTAEMLKVKGLADMPEQSLGGSMQVSKSLSVSSDRAELFASGEMNWSSSELPRRSASPVSPSTRRKRLRKSSTGSGSGSTERTSEDAPSEVLLIPSPAVVKPEAAPGALGNSAQGASTDSEPREGSQDSVEDDPDPLVMMSQDCSVEARMADPGGVPVPSYMGAQHQQLSAQAGGKAGKRGRLLIRQPRVKKEPDGAQASPEGEPCAPRLPCLLAVPPPSHLAKQASLPAAQGAGPAVQRQLSQPLERPASVAPEQDPPQRVWRSASSPQAASSAAAAEPHRSVHCPALRPGPALGCNFCWNTIDGHGRILRRKTKYHCPECQTNLCIVPCFQEYHERLAVPPGALSPAPRPLPLPLRRQAVPAQDGLRLVPLSC
ncbi:protein tramtrack, beta isoform isoform X1 [Bacillus rossius redtenbacheri]|uniref:protein tramtrack, beta isoform isoform X1 n=1 Tax=Bacillus rossius redtenbacheri TaxID=93214 RepID=UPI002FDEBF78